MTPSEGYTSCHVRSSLSRWLDVNGALCYVAAHAHTHMRRQKFGIRLKLVSHDV